MTGFTCNICGAQNPLGDSGMDREAATCSGCGSSLRVRGLLHALAVELFGTEVRLPDFPRVKSLRGLGTSDGSQYADRLAERLDYRNTFLDREPRFNLADPPADEFGKYDFVISSEVLEHVPPPVENAFRNVFRLLKPGGVFVFTVPYSLERSTAEHYPDLYRYGFAEVDSKTVLVNRTRSGELQVFENLVFHFSSGERALELREFAESDLKANLTNAGFTSVKTYSGDCPAFGIVRSETWSLPMAARKGDFRFSLDSTREIVEHWRELHRKHARDMEGLCRSFWFRLGRKLRLF